MSASPLDNLKSSEGILGKIQNFFGRGYSDKENLRELDRKLRDAYYQSFKAMRHRWEEIYLAYLQAGRKGDDFKKVIQVMDRLAEKINRADYGYAALFDRKGSIREEELTRIFELDRAFGSEIASFSSLVDGLYADYEEESWGVFPPKVKKIRSAILELERKWDEREKQFRPLGV